MTASEVLRRYEDEDLPEFDGIESISIETVGRYGNRPLHIACVRGDLEEVGALIAAGANVNVRGEHGNTPLHEAVGSSSAMVLNHLLANGADHLQRNDFGQTARDVASLMNRTALVAIIESHERNHAPRH
jgi:uncharacterized protein